MDTPSAASLNPIPNRQGDPPQRHPSGRPILNGISRERVLVQLYDFSVKTSDGGSKSLRDYKGQVILVVNTASKCGFTPQYAGLQSLYERHQSRRFVVLAFPCNQFGKQEPGSDDEIQNFCRANYGVTFPVFAKIDVNGEHADQLYQYLTSLEPAGDIQWNFTKFLFDRQGGYLKRYEPSTTPEDLDPDVSTALSQDR